MNAGYQIFMALFTIGVVCAGINQIGLWPTHKLPSQSFDVTTTQVYGLHDKSRTAEFNFFTMWDLIIAFMTVIGSGFLAVFSLAALFYGLGWPIGVTGAAILQMLQTPATLVMMFFFYEQWTGRVVE